MITTVLLILIEAAPAKVILMEGAFCGARDSDEMFVRVLERESEVAARVLMSTAAVSDKGEISQNDTISDSVTTGPGYAKMKWKPWSDFGKQLVKAGWVVLRMVFVYFRDQLVASVAVDLTRKGGRCLIVQL